jgi:hypothetical protein
LPAVLCRCESSCLALKEEHIQVLRRIFGHKRDEIIGSWRNLHNEELHNLYFSTYVITMMKPRRIK